MAGALFWPSYWDLCCDIYLGIWQDDRYSKYVGETAIVPMTYGRHVPIISDKVNSDMYSYCFSFSIKDLPELVSVRSRTSKFLLLGS